ncbi:MAG: hypothetical protein J2P41_10020, partial [Blastocatellia bacterium]|nr:hypothetical protein [Blastocatellia bacterium]
MSSGDMKYHLMIAFLCSLPVGLSTFSVHPTGRVHQQSEEVRTLTSGAPVEREISGGQSQVWQINLSSGDYLRLTVREKTGELAGSLFAPAGVERGNERKPLLSSAEENIFIQHDANLREVMTFSLIAEISGVYSLETSLDKNSGPTRYEVEIEALR